MSFDINSIPVGSRTQQAVAVHQEMYKASLDTCRVHNPTNKKFVVYNDRKFSGEKWEIPAVDVDLGFGPGNQDVPRFIAYRYLQKMGIELINAIIKLDWEKQKVNYQRAEWGKMEEGLALRSSNPKLWDDIIPTLWIGVQQRYGGDDIEDEPEADGRPEGRNMSFAIETIERLGLKDKEYNVDLQKKELEDQLT